MRETFSNSPPRTHPKKPTLSGDLKCVKGAFDKNGEKTTTLNRAAISEIYLVKCLQTWQLLGTTDEIRDPVSGGVVVGGGDGLGGGAGGGRVVRCQWHILSNNTLNRRAVEFYAVQLALSLSLSFSLSLPYQWCHEHGWNVLQKY